MSGRRLLIGWVAVFTAALGLLLVAAVDGGGLETDGERIQRLSDSFACPQCRGESVSESNAAVAATIRELIRDEVSKGTTDEEIRDTLIQGYGSRVLLNPPADGFSSLLWILPVVLVVGGAAGVTAMVSREGRAADGVSDIDRELVEAARRTRAQEPESTPGSASESES